MIALIIILRLILCLTEFYCLIITNIL